MPLLFSVVARNGVILAKYATCAGNFAEVTKQILMKISPHEDKLTYSHGNYLFHYIKENGLVYFCITDDEFDRSRAFLFLKEIHRRFVTTYGEEENPNATHALFNSEFGQVLANEMKRYSEPQAMPNMLKVHGELGELKDIMVKNIDVLTMRGEKLELLINKADNLATASVSYRATSRTLQRSLFWKNVKMYVIIGAVLILLVYLLVAMGCGGLAWQKCLS